MRSVRPWLAIVVFAVVVMGLVSLGIKLFSRAALASGCQGLGGTGQIDPAATVAFWNSQEITPLTALAENLTGDEKQVLGVATGERWIEVDLSEQKLTAHQGDTVFLESPISSGLSFPTPPGEYFIWYKIRFTKMEGGSQANKTYYNLPNVPYTMFFHNGYAVHGTYWHNNFGQRMSHGCVNTPTPIAEKLFYWAGPQLPPDKAYVRSTPDNPGTKVIVHP